MTERIKDIAILAIIALLPLGIWGSVVHYGHAHTLMLAALVVVAISMPNPYLKAFLLYLACWCAYIVATCFLGIREGNATLLLLDGCSWIICAAVLFLAVYHSKIKAERFYDAICIASLIQASIGIAQFYGFDPISLGLGRIIKVTSEIPFTTPVGTLGNPNFLGAFLAISALFFLRRKWFFLLPIILFALGISHARAAAMAFIIGAAFYGYSKFEIKNILPICIGATVMAAVYWFSEGRGTGDRFEMWQDGIQKTCSSLQTIVFGFGPNAQWKQGDQLHSEYVMTFFNYGLVGLAIMAEYIRKIYRGNVLLFSVFIIICVNGIANHLLHTIPTMLLAVTVAALIEREKENQI